MVNIDAQNTAKKKLLVPANRNRISTYADAVCTVQQKLRVEYLCSCCRKKVYNNKYIRKIIFFLLQRAYSPNNYLRTKIPCEGARFIKMKKKINTIKAYISWYKQQLQMIYPTLLDHIYFRLRGYDRSRYNRRLIECLIDKELSSALQPYRSQKYTDLDSLYHDVINHIGGKYNIINPDYILEAMCFKLLRKKGLESETKYRVFLLLRKLTGRSRDIKFGSFPEAPRS